MLTSGISGRSDDRRGSRRPRAGARGVALAGLVCATGLALAWPAAAEPYRLGGVPVVVDYGVLDSLGPPVPEATSVPSVPTIRRALPPGFGPTVRLKPPPSKPPQSTLTAEQPPEESAPAPTQSAGLSEQIDELTRTESETASDTTPTPPPPPTEIEPPPQPAMPEPEATTPSDETADSGTVDESSAASETEAASTEASEFEPPADEGMEATEESAESAPAAEEPAVETPEPPAPAETAEVPPAEGTTTESAPAEETAAEAPPEEESSQTAALPPAATAEGQMRIEFPEGSAEIPESARQALDALATQLNGDEAMRVQLLAYASGSADAASRARRMSLSRALAVRAYLIAQGVRSTRMDVRALGNNVEGEPADRVDIIPQAQ